MDILDRYLAEVLPLIDAERILLEFSLALERARTDRALALSMLEVVTGTKLMTYTQEEEVAK